MRPCLTSARAPRNVRQQRARSEKGLTITLTEVPYYVDRIRWKRYWVRTGGIRGPLHAEWTLTVAFTSPLRRVRVAVFVDADGVRASDKHQLRHATHTFQVSEWFRPLPKSPSIAEALTDSAERTNIRDAVTVLVRKGDELTTARPIVIATDSRRSSSLGIVAVCSTDTHDDRMRWRVKTPVAGPLADHSYLNSGRFVLQEPLQ